MLLRLLQGRPILHRVAGRSLLIGDVPWVAQSLEATHPHPSPSPSPSPNPNPNPTHCGLCSTPKRTTRCAIAYLGGARSRARVRP